MIIGKFFTNIFASEIAAEDSTSISRFGNYKNTIIAS
jgi:hypothetical protein